MPNLQISDYATEYGASGNYYLTSQNASDLEDLRGVILELDVPLHLGYDIYNTGSVESLTLDHSVTLLAYQGGSFILWAGGQTDPPGVIEIRGALEAPPVADIFSQTSPSTEEFPGGIFRFERLIQNPFDTQVVFGSRCVRVNASWFGIPNATDEDNAWLLRKAILSGEEEKIPIYVPPGEYHFTEPVLPTELGEARVPISALRLNGSPAGSTDLAYTSGTAGTSLFFISPADVSAHLKDVNLQHLGFYSGEARDALFIKYVDGMHLGNLRFVKPSAETYSGRHSIDARGVKNVWLSNCDIRDARHNAVIFGCFDNSQLWYPSESVLAVGNYFNNPNMDTDKRSILVRHIITFAQDDQVKRQTKFVFNNNIFLDLACTAIGPGQNCGNIVASGNVIEFNESSDDEPMTIGGLWPDSDSDEVASVQFNYAGNSIVNNRIPPEPPGNDFAGCILVWNQAKGGLFWANQINGGQYGFYLGGGLNSGSTEYTRIHEHLLYQANLLTQGVSPRDFSIRAAQWLGVAITNHAKNIVIHENAQDYPKLLSQGGNVPDEILENIRITQGWQPSNPIDGANTYTLDHLFETVWLVQPRNFFTAYHKATSTITLNGMLAFAEMGTGFSSIAQIFGSSLTQAEPEYIGMRCLHQRDPSSPESINQLTQLAANAPSIDIGPQPIVEAAVSDSPTPGVERADFKLVEADWNTGLLKLEDLYLWVRSDGRIGVKEQASPPTQDPPTSDTDGTLIPIQAEAVTDMETSYTWKEIAQRLNDLLGKLRISGSIAA